MMKFDFGGFFRKLSVSVASLTILAGPAGADPPTEAPSRTAERILRQEEITRRAEEARRKAEEAKEKAAEAAQQRGEAATGGETDDSAGKTGTPRHPTRFQCSGQQAWAVASRHGWKFFPRGARGALDGNGTTAQMHPGINTSLVRGPLMQQWRTPAQWTTLSQNVFLMFANASGGPKEMAPGWKLLELEVAGQNWRWVSRPAKGASSPFFAIEITGLKGPAEYSAAEVTRLVLEGPANAKSWQEAFLPAR